MMSVIFIDQDIQFGALLKQLLSHCQGMAWVGETQTGAQGIDLIKKYKSKHPLRVLLNTQLPDMLGESACRFIYRRWPEGTLYFFNESGTLAGLKPFDRVAGEGICLERRLLFKPGCHSHGAFGKNLSPVGFGAGVTALPGASRLPALESLSPREYEVLMMLASNKTYDEMVIVMHISLKTAYNLKRSVCQKLKIEDPEQIRGLMFSAGQFKT